MSSTVTRASNATKLPNGDTVLGFSEGGWQQARGASLHAYAGHLGNRYYMEGSIEFLDDESEWHFDPETRRLTIVAPPGATLAPPSTLDGLGADELSRVAQRLQGELLELRTVVERLEADKKQVVGMYRALEREHAELVRSSPACRCPDLAVLTSFSYDGPAAMHVLTIGVLSA